MNYEISYLQALQLYEPGLCPSDLGSSIKLNQNESPYPPSSAVTEALVRYVGESLRYYPHADCYELREALSGYTGHPISHIFVGNGSSELISIFMRVYVGPGGKLALPDPTFSLYASAAALYGAEVVPVPLLENWEVDVDGLLQSGARAVVLVNPNAPTGVYLKCSEVERLVQHFPGLVLIDEAYMELALPHGGKSALSLVDRYPNLIVIRTFSKVFGLAGVRVGYAIAQETLINGFRKGADLYNVNGLSQQLAVAALQDRAYLNETVNKILVSRQKLEEGLRELGFTIVPSSANFLLCQPPVGHTAGELYTDLLEHRVYVRYFQQHPRLLNQLRISIGTEEQCRDLVQLLKELLMEHTPMELVHQENTQQG